MSRRRALLAAAMSGLGLTTAITTVSIAGQPAGAADLPVVVTERPDPLFDALTIPPDAATRGAWGDVVSWPLLAIHSALLPDGSVITYGTPGDESQAQQARLLDIWNPWQGTEPLAHLTVPNGGSTESFCSLAILMPNGDYLIAGGNTPLGTAVYDHASKTARAVSDLHQNRWYGTMTMLPDGRPLVTGGADAYQFTMKEGVDVSSLGLTPEIYDPITGWSLLEGATSVDAFGPEQNKWWYPRQWVAPNGKVFGVSADQMYWLDVAGAGSVTLAGSFKTPATLAPNDAVRPNVGATSTAVMYAPGRILQVGGNGYYNDYPTESSNLASIIDINGTAPVVTETTPMSFARQWGNATVLPDGTVFVNGGTATGNSETARVLASEMWDPTTGEWTTMAPAATSRLYHSSSVLLPTGAVFTAGGGAPGDAFNQNAQVYYPPYLFTTKADGTVVEATRPVISRLAAQQFAYGSPIDIQLSDDTAIESVSLIALSSTTHSSNMGQRRLTLDFAQTGDRLTIHGTNANAAPPGFYQLSVTGPSGTPSEAVIIGIGTNVGTMSVVADDQPTAPTPTTAPPTTAPPTTAPPTTTTTPVGPPPPPESNAGASDDRPDGFVGLTPRRVLDTRPDTQTGYTGDKPAPGHTLTVQLPDIPDNATAATLNITGTDPTNNGYVTVWPCGTEQPNTSTLNLTTGITSPNAVITQLGTNHTICIYTETGTHLLADLTGYLS